MKKEINTHYSEEDKFSSDSIIELENEFISAYLSKGGKPIKLLVVLYKRYWGKLVISSFLYVIKHSPLLFMPIIIANIINVVADRPENAMQIFSLNIVVITLLLAINIPAHIIHTKFYSIAMRSVEAGLRGAMVKKLQQLSISFNKEMQSGRIQSKIMRDVEAIHTMSSQVFVGILSISINIIVAVCVVVSSSLVVFAFFLVCCPLAVLITVLFKKPIIERNFEFRNEMEDTSARVMNMVEMIPVTRAHAVEKQEIRSISEKLNLIAEKGYRLDLVQALFGSISWVMFEFCQIICLAFTAYMAYKGSIKLGDITLYQAYFTSIVSQVSALITLLPILTKGTESLMSLGEILTASDIENNRDKKKIKLFRGEYNFNNLSFSYGDKSVLDSLNMVIKQGETIAIVGESGSGKSTILNLIIGFITADSGSLLVDGVDIKEIDLHNYRKNLAVVPQNSVLFTGTIRDNITYGTPNVADADLQRVLDASCLTEFLKTLPDGVDTMLSEHGGNLSGGQKQRISIARAIIRDPRVIILDEATSALDTVSEKEIQKAINNLRANRTTFIVAHRLSTIKDADKIIVMSNGICVERGTFTQLMDKKGEFYKMQKLQS